MSRSGCGDETKGRRSTLTVCLSLWRDGIIGSALTQVREVDLLVSSAARRRREGMDSDTHKDRGRGVKLIKLTVLLECFASIKHLRILRGLINSHLKFAKPTSKYTRSLPERKGSNFLLIWLIRKGFSPAKYSV